MKKTKLVLNVAEKPSIAKILAGFLRSGEFSKEHSYSKFNPVFRFRRKFKNHEDAELLVTSVTGHITNFHFDLKYKDWNSCDPKALITEATINTKYSEDKQPIVKNLEKWSPKATDLVLWLDCDREGENIAFEVVDLCCKINPSLQIHRARFSAATRSDIVRAYNNLKQPDRALSDVDSNDEGS